MTSRHHQRVHHSAAYVRARAEMFATRGTVCAHCGHEGAGEADLITPLSIDPEQTIDAAALQPSHGANYPCPTCGRKCNSERGNKVDYAQFRSKLVW